MPSPSLTRRAATAGILLMSAVAGPATGQSTYPRFEISGRLQEQFYWFDNAGHAADVGPASSFFIRRARIQANAQITERISLVIQPSYEGGRSLEAETVCDPIEVPGEGESITPGCTTTGESGFRLRDAYIDVRLSPAPSRTTVTLRVGQEKRPFSRYELLSSNNLPTIERGAGDGLASTASNNLFEGGGYLSTDVGAALLVGTTLGERTVALHAGVYNGQGESLSDVNAAKSYGARLVVGVLPRLSVGASAFRHDYILGTGATADSSAYNSAWGVDMQWGAPGKPGPFALAEYLRGERLDAPETNMSGVSLIGAWHLPVAGGWVEGIEPALRFDVADQDVDASDDRATLFSAVMGVYFSGRAQARVAYESQSYESDFLEPIRGVRSALTVNF
jgi:hypothetical protein